MQHCKILVSFLLTILIYGCSDKNKFESRGFNVSTTKDSTLVIRDNAFQLFLFHPTDDSDNTSFDIPFMGNLLYFNIDDKEGNWSFGQLQNKILEGKLLQFDKYQAVTSVSWFHDNQLFYCYTVSPLRTKAVNFNNMKLDHIHPPNFIVNKDSLLYHFTIEQNTYPIVLSGMDCKYKFIEFRDDMVSNVRDFYIKVDSLPFTVGVDYHEGDGKPIKYYQWNSSTDSVIEVKVNQL
jgi:hypothetical protein